MKVKLNEVLKDIDGKTPLKSEIRKGKLMTAKEMCIRALFTPIQKQSREQKYLEYDLATRLREIKEDVVELEVKEISIIKDKVGDVLPQLIMGQIWDILEMVNRK